MAAEATARPELELKANTELTREIDKLTIEPRNRLAGKTDGQRP